jgi:hypothetical protein
MDDNALAMLLGAGASRPFLHLDGKSITTELLMEQIRSNDQLWRDVWRLFETEMARRASSFDDNLELAEVLRIRDLIVDIFQHSLFSNTNFEYVVHLLDKVAYYFVAHRPAEVCQLDAKLLALSEKANALAAPRIPVWLPRCCIPSWVTAGSLRALAPKSSRDGWRYVPWLIREIIIEVILRAWEQEDPATKNQTIQTLRDFFFAVRQRYARVHIYTLNYDPLIVAALDHTGSYRSGFNPSGEF